MTAVAGLVSSSSGTEGETPTEAAVADAETLFAEEAATKVASSNRATPKKFISNLKPDQKIELSTGTLVEFVKGVAYTTSKKDTNAMLKIAHLNSVVEA